jgi:cupin fold WbuC family metalloprotein
MIEFSTSFLDDLVFRAALSPRSRQHYNVHSGPHEPCQRLFNAIGMDSYIRPHRHLLDPRNELLVAVRGSFAVLKFDDRGVVAGAVRMSAGEGAPGAGRLAAGVELEPEDWHTVIALVPGSVLLEVKALYSVRGEGVCILGSRGRGCRRLCLSAGTPGPSCGIRGEARS